MSGEHVLPSLIRDSDGDVPIETKWEITCGGPHSDTSLPAHSVRFWIDKIRGRPVTDVGIEVTYSQYNKKAYIVYRQPFVRHEETDFIAYEEPVSDEGRFAEMQEELRDLKDQRHQLDALIRARESAIADAIRLSYGDAGAGMAHCDSMKCVLQVAFYDARQVVKSAKSSVMSVLSGHGHHHSHWPHWGHHGNGTRGNCTHLPPHGNHTHPRPPHRKPHFPPGFCHCPPPPDGPPGEGPPHRRPGPPEKVSHASPGTHVILLIRLASSRPSAPRWPTAWRTSRFRPPTPALRTWSTPPRTPSR